MGRVWVSGEAEVELLKELFVRAWIKETVQPDADRGMTVNNFLGDNPGAEMNKNRPKNKDIKVYLGSGNYFMVDMRPKDPMIIQRRPLGQRMVQLVKE